MSLGAFDAPPYRFEVDDGFGVVELGERLLELEIDDLDARLAASAELPPLDGAPIASWILARLAALVAGGDLGLTPGLVEHIDGGVFVLDFVVARAGVLVAKVQLQAGMIGAGLLGVVRSDEAPGALASALVRALGAAPAAVAAVEVRIVDPEWALEPEVFSPPPSSESVGRFGYDGARYLGRGNVAPREP